MPVDGSRRCVRHCQTYFVLLHQSTLLLVSVNSLLLARVDSSSRVSRLPIPPSFLLAKSMVVGQPCKVHGGMPSQVDGTQLLWRGWHATSGGQKNCPTVVREGGRCQRTCLPKPYQKIQHWQDRMGTFQFRLPFFAFCTKIWNPWHFDNFTKNHGILVISPRKHGILVEGRIYYSKKFYWRSKYREWLGDTQKI